jgi:hypothetical protein
MFKGIFSQQVEEQLSKRKYRATCGVWRVACGVWRVACGVWRVACDVWRVACDVRRVTCDVFCRVQLHTSTSLSLCPKAKYSRSGRMVGGGGGGGGGGGA